MAAARLLWLRQDLRLADHPALTAAVEAGAGRVALLYVLDDETPGEDRIGGAQRWWLHHSLAALAQDVSARGGQLILRRGRCGEVVPAVAREAGASVVHATRLYEPWWKQADAEVGAQVELRLHDGNYLAPPPRVTTGSGGRFRIFTPYWRRLRQLMPPPASLPAPKRIVGVELASDRLEDWTLLPTKPNWATEFDTWKPGEAGARANLERFASQVGRYGESRNLPSEVGTSQLSPHLHFGEVSPATVWHRLDEGEASEPYLREIGWRDFTANTIDQYPTYARQHGRSQHDLIKFRTGPDADADFRAWSKGRTGYPIVDAGMRQLWRTGWMHNRVRMIAASFLVKHLLIDWRRGERWFWDTLVDADYGSNSVNWQWIAGSGVDSNQFTRIMAPLGQSEKFGAGDYIRRWVPELEALHDDQIHDPHELGVAPAPYPKPLIGHREARERALAAYRAAKAA